MPRLSIVIPALGAWEQLEATLVAVLANRPADAEIVVALHDGYDDPYALEGEVRFVRLPPNATLVDAWNEAFAVCQAPVVHLLACGAVVSENWCDAALRDFDDPRVAAVAPLVTSTDEQFILTAGWHYSMGGVASHFAAGESATSLAEPDDRWIGPHGAAAFYRRSALAPAAFDVSLGDVLAPVDLALRLRAAGYQSMVEPRCRVALAGLPGGSRFSALQAEQLFWRHAACDGWWQPAIAHVGAVAIEFGRALPHPGCLWQLAQRFAGLVSARRRAHAVYPLPPYADAESSDASSSSHRFHASHGRDVRRATRRAQAAKPTAASEAR